MAGRRVGKPGGQVRPKPAQRRFHGRASVGGSLLTTARVAREVQGSFRLHQRPLRPHNGLRDIVARLGSRDFTRIRVGIGRPTRGDVSGWVLSDFSTAERAELDDVVDTARRALDCILAQGVQAAMNEINRLPA